MFSAALGMPVSGLGYLTKAGNPEPGHLGLNEANGAEKKNMKGETNIPYSINLNVL